MTNNNNLGSSYATRQRRHLLAARRYSTRKGVTNMPSTTHSKRSSTYSPQGDTLHARESRTCLALHIPNAPPPTRRKAILYTRSGCTTHSSQHTLLAPHTPRTTHSLHYTSTYLTQHKQRYSATPVPLHLPCRKISIHWTNTMLVVDDDTTRCWRLHASNKCVHILNK